ncbi:glyoxalase [Actinoplanes sp. NBRC 14428]|uniref:Putative enzyme related to lactoylglutathione lyase n=1 Tax=Pseudosporangium ferrugineum TaxID=439699 RepID=A0A2T0SDB0_9ACTN|nr:VOC family protein [Pseudosporangium ferrugineum]PRY31404.1 putative enzyme related to lactoylglutathione lyase [Pseudosporangium ferrugineum]BCJ54452.1 glyoxalase [Actinoplanes sp. NBRC 14428]
MTVTGPDFIALQVRDLEKAADFYESRLGLQRAPVAPPHAVVFATTPAFAVREPLPGLDLDAVTPQPGAGVVLWFGADDAQAVHDRLAADGVPITVPPFDGPFGRTFTFTDPDGYAVTIHDRA